MSKTCFKCHAVKELSEFHAHKAMADGHLNKCKVCANSENRSRVGTVRVICAECGLGFKTDSHAAGPGGRKLCSRRCYRSWIVEHARRDSEAPRWKGDDAGKEALHSWEIRHRGRPRICEHCKTEEAKKYEWSNISREYKRDLSDWQRLCTSCHLEYDREARGSKWKHTVTTKYGWNVQKY